MPIQIFRWFRKREQSPPSCNLAFAVSLSCLKDFSMSDSRTIHTLPGHSRFPTTRWTLVLAAGDPGRKEARSALVSLCENYWYPLYAYLRRRGYSADQAQDLTQEFFIRLLEGRYLDRADPEKGRFRSFILTSLKFFVADEADRQRAHKRGGGAVVPLELSSGEDRYQREPAHDETPERIYERRWALSVLDRVVERLRNEFVLHGLFTGFASAIASSSARELPILWPIRRKWSPN